MASWNQQTTDVSQKGRRRFEEFTLQKQNSVSGLNMMVSMASFGGSQQPLFILMTERRTFDLIFCLPYLLHCEDFFLSILLSF
jgi:hypothetical protein